MRSKRIKQTVPRYSFTVSEEIQPFLQETMVEQFSKIIRKQSREIAKEIIQDFKFNMTERGLADSGKREFATTIRKKESWEK